jgi:hypothetical protein
VLRLHYLAALGRKNLHKLRKALTVLTGRQQGQQSGQLDDLTISAPRKIARLDET